MENEENKNNILGSIALLDCTLRDGGFALEDAIKNNITTELLSDEDREYIQEKILEANIDIIEIGAIEISNDSKKGMAIYQTIQEISKDISVKRKGNQLIAAFYRGPDVDINEIPEWHPGLIDAPRVCIRYSEMRKSLDFCKGLAQRGYKVFIQPMVTMRYSLDEIKMLIDAANCMNAYALYFVDSYGCMTSKDVKFYLDLYDKGLDKNIKIGFHAHNNMEMAFSNVMSFIYGRKNRNIIIDSCAMGMGQGTGNLQTEVIANFLNTEFEKSYKIEEILEVCDKVAPLNVNQLWGYSPLRFVPAMNKTAYKYAMNLKNVYGYSVREINNILKDIPLEFRYRYTPEYAKNLVEKYQIDNS